MDLLPPHLAALVREPAPAATRRRGGGSGGGGGKKKRKRRQALFRSLNPVVRISADATNARPPRWSYGYSLVAASFRDGVPGTSNRSADRVFIADNFCGSNEQIVAGVLEGIGPYGPTIADFVASLIGACLLEVAKEHARRRRRPPTPPPARGAVVGSMTRLINAAKALWDSVEHDSEEEAGLADTVGKRAGKGGGGAGAGAGGGLGSPGGAPRPRKGRVTAADRVAAILTDTVARLDSKLATHTAVDTLASGTSMTLAVLRGRNLVVANVGGCRAVLGREVDASEVDVMVRDAVKAYTSVEAAALGAYEAAAKRERDAARASRLGGGGSGGEGVSAGPSQDDDEEPMAVLLQPQVTDVSKLGEKLRDRATARGGGSSSGVAGEGSTALVPAGGSSSGGAALAAGQHSRRHDVQGDADKALVGVSNRVRRLAESVSTIDVRAGVPASIEDARSRQYRHTASIPSFPDLPVVIERALKVPDLSYVKPSEALRAAREHQATTYRDTTGALLRAYADGIGGSWAAKRGATLVPDLGAASTGVSRTGREAGGYLPRLAPLQHTRAASAASGGSGVPPVDFTRPPQGWELADAGKMVFRRHFTLHKYEHEVSRQLRRQDAAEAAEAAGAPPHSSLSDRTASAGYGEGSGGASYGGGGGGYGVGGDGGAEAASSSALVGRHGRLGGGAPSPLSNQTHQQRDGGLDGPARFGQELKSKVPPRIADLVATGLQRKPAGAAGAKDPLTAHGLLSAAPGKVELTSGGPTFLLGAETDLRYFDDHGRPVRVCVPVPLSTDHRPDRPSELSRIAAAGGKVATGAFADGGHGTVPRIFGASMDGPGLAVSRCLGYRSARRWGVSAEPEVLVHPIGPDDRFVILASDGLWAVLSSDEAVSVVSKACASVLWGGSGVRPAPLSGSSSEEDEEDEEEEEEEEGGKGGTVTLGRASGSIPHPRARASLRLPLNGVHGHPHPASALDAVEEEPDVSYVMDRLGSSAVEVTPYDQRRAAQAPPRATGLDRLGASALPPELQARAEALVSKAARMDPTAQVAQRAVMPPHAHAAPLQHGPESPADEIYVSVAAGLAPVAGCGGGCDVAMDLRESVVAPAVRSKRTERRRRAALYAAEALVAAARAKWHALTNDAATAMILARFPHILGSEAIAAYRSPHDDIAVTVLLLDDFR